MQQIFVFGSNLAGLHGAGSALEAYRHHGAKYGRGMGLQGNSYAIPTKDKHLRTLSLPEVSSHVRTFIDFAKEHPEMTFNVVKVGCGLAGFTEKQISPLFVGAPTNCNLPEGWAQTGKPLETAD